MQMENETSYRNCLFHWEQNMHNLRRKYRNTPVGYQEIRQERETEDHLRDFREKLAESRKMKILNPPIEEERMFAGRKTELAQMEEILKRKQKVLLYGIGGIGKSALARFYGYQKQRQGIKVLFLTCQNNILEMIVSDAQLTISNYTYNARQYRSKRAYFRAKLNALKEMAENEKFLVIVDDFNLEKDRYLKELLEIPCKFIFTSRVVPELFDESSRILVRGIAENEWEEFCRLYLKRDYPRDAILKKREEAQNHTLFMKLYLFRLNGESGKEGELTRADVGVENLKPLHGLSLKKREKLFLLWMSLLPVEGIDKEVFCMICGAEEAEFKRLLQWNLLEESPQIKNGKCRLRIHSIIAGEIRRQLPPSYENCRFFVERFAGYLGGELDGIETWNRSYEENAKLVEPVLCLTRKFKDPPVRMLMKYDEFATLLWVQGYFQEAEKITVKSFQKAASTCGEGNKLTAYLAGRVAAVYHNRNMHTEADIWYRKSLECFEQIPEAQITAEAARNEMDILTKLQRKAWLENREAEADLYYQKALELEAVRKKAPGQQEVLFSERCIQYVQMYHALSLSRRGMSEEALTIMRDCMKEPQIRDSRYCFMEFRCNYARILYEYSQGLPAGSKKQKESLEAAEKIARETAQASEKFRGVQYYYTQLQRELLADILLAQGRYEEGRDVLEEILSILQEYLPYDKTWMERIMAKF